MSQYGRQSYNARICGKRVYTKGSQVVKARQAKARLYIMLPSGGKSYSSSVTKLLL
jgi:hypothetical protein